MENHMCIPIAFRFALSIVFMLDTTLCNPLQAGGNFLQTVCSLSKKVVLVRLGERTPNNET